MTCIPRFYPCLRIRITLSKGENEDKEVHITRGNFVIYVIYMYFH